MTDYIPYSQRHGGATPRQLEIGTLDKKTRLLLWEAIHYSIDSTNNKGLEGEFYGEMWRNIVRFSFPRFLDLPSDKFTNHPYIDNEYIKNLIFNGEINLVFDFLEFCMNLSSIDTSFAIDRKINFAFSSAKTPYRVIDGGLITPVVTDELASTINNAISDSNDHTLAGSRKHLRNAASELNLGNWSDSIRESIHAVESTCKFIAGEGATLGKAIAVIEKNRKISSQLKNAITQLYAYTNSDEGIRHALVFNDTDTQSESEAIFMLGVCSSFVTYMLSKHTE